MWKIQLTIANNFFSSIDNDEECVMYSKRDKIKIMINDEADEVIEELFKSLKNRYQSNLESMEGSEFVFNYVHLLYYPINKKANKCFQYAITIALNHEKLKKNLQRITKMKSFLNKYNLEGITFPSEKNDWKHFEKNSAAIALNVLYAGK